MHIMTITITETTISITNTVMTVITVTRFAVIIPSVLESVLVTLVLYIIMVFCGERIIFVCVTVCVCVCVFVGVVFREREGSRERVK